MTKADLIKKINECASAYLGFTVSLSGLRSKSKTVLHAMSLDYAELAELQRQYTQGKARYTDKDILYFHISGDIPPDYAEVLSLQNAAMAIWERKY